MSAYQALHQGYSPIYNDRVVRVSMCDDRSQEFFAVIGAGKTREGTYRERLDKTLDMLQDAIDSGRAPGEVRMQ